MSNLKELIQDSLNKEGKLNCEDAYKISAKSKSSITEVGQTAKDIDIRISNCQLGQFGNLKGTGAYSMRAENKLKRFLDDKNRITCKNARGQAGGVGFEKVRGTLKDKNIDVTYCELGCFKEKKR
ncbi:MAG: hypothetical protein JJV94_01595 [Sulfurospirillum sp.]|nr:hypothetical protein [Sulfurospirillum sp.]